MADSREPVGVGEADVLGGLLAAGKLDDVPFDVRTVTGRQGNSYQLEDLGHRWSKMTHPQCGKTVTFVNPRPDRVRWYTDSHRCDGPGWQGE